MKNLFDVADGSYQAHTADMMCAVSRGSEQRIGCSMDQAVEADGVAFVMVRSRNRGCFRNP